MSSAHPYAPEFLARDWRVLLDVCSLARRAEKISVLAAEIRDPESLLSLAEQHGVIAQLSGAVANLPSGGPCDALRDALRIRHRTQALATLGMTSDLFRVLDRLRQSNIECVVVKGPVLALRAYGDPAARRYGDIDALVRHADIADAAEILTSAGYESRVSLRTIREGKIPGQYLFVRPGTKFIFELHTERTLRYFPKRLPIEGYFRDKAAVTLDGHAVPALSLEHEFVLISIHGAKHFWERLMWISDVAAMVCNHPELDWKRVRLSAREVGAERMVHLALLLSERLLGVAVPAELKIDVARDSVCRKLANSIESRLPYGGYATPSILGRAMFRFRMHGDALGGAGYITRLSFATTEEDWSPDNKSAGSRIAETLLRPLRLAKKYRRSPDS